VTSTTSLFRDYFGQLEGLPCWETSTEFGTWISLRFGNPTIRIREGNPDGETERQRRRRVYVEGEFLLWFEMGQWEFFENNKLKFHSGQSRAYLRRAANRLQSQCLASVEFLPDNTESKFEFDLGARLIVRPTADAEDDDSMWHLYTRDRCLTMLANGTLEHGPSRAKRRSRLKAKLASYSGK
jgi:hypothetical protein